jgi:hypothetical protein
MQWDPLVPQHWLRHGDNGDKEPWRFLLWQPISNQSQVDITITRHINTYSIQYILNISNIMPLGFPLGHESPDVSRLNLDPDGQTQGLWECKAGPEDLVNFGKTNRFMPGKWERNRQQQVYGTR